MSSNATRHLTSSPPDVALLSNGRYSVLLTEAGSGYSVHDGMDVTRWRTTPSMAAPTWRRISGKG